MTTIPVTRLCATHRGPHAPLATHGHICTACHHHLTTTLADLPRLWDAMTDLATTHQSGGGCRGPNSSAPIRLDVLALTDPRSGPDPAIPPAAGIITDWATLIATDRHWRLPATITARIHLLDRALPWIEDQAHLIADFTRELRDVHHALRHLAGETATVIATCRQPHPDPQHDGECGGPLLHTTDSAWPVRCANCGDAWSAGGLTLALEQLELRQWRHADSDGA